MLHLSDFVVFGQGFDCASVSQKCAAERQSSTDGKKRSFLTVGWSG
jgi:hypothetical protein